MSAKAGTIQGTQTGVPNGAWITAILLTAMIAVALFAVNTSGRTSQTAPITAKVETTVPVGFSHVAPSTAQVETTVPVGFSHVAPTTGGKQLQPIVINGSVCHQCL